MDRRTKIIYINGKLDGNVQALRAALAVEHGDEGLDAILREIEAGVANLSNYAIAAVDKLIDNALDREDEDEEDHVPDWREDRKASGGQA